MKKVVLIPDSFKGTLSSAKVCEIMSKCIHNKFPDCEIVQIPVAEAMGARAYRITKMEEVEPVLKEALAAGEPVVIDCVIESDDKVFPMVAPGKNLEDVFDEEDLNAES